VAVRAFLANAATPIPLAAAAGIAIGNALEALVGAGILRRAAGGARPDFESMPTVRTLVLTAAPLGALVSAGFGVSALALTGALPPGTALSAGAVWWTGDVLGALVVAPVLLVWLVSRRRPGTRGVLEIALLCLGTAAASELALGRLVDLPLLRGLDYLYLLFPFVVWAALRFGSRGASLMTLTISIVAVWRTVAEAPFAGDSLGATLFAAACYLGVVAGTGLILRGSGLGERATAAITLRQREEQLREALDAARMGTWSWSAAEDRVVWDDALRRLCDLAPGEEVTTYAQYRARSARGPAFGRGRRCAGPWSRATARLRVPDPAGRRPDRWIETRAGWCGRPPARRSASPGSPRT
jgi:PAS domain-containing protein